MLLRAIRKEKDLGNEIDNNQRTSVRRLPHHTYAWIEDEGLLRDEGVVAGLAGADLEAKVAAIRSYYEDWLANVRDELERIARKEKAIEKKEDSVRAKLERLLIQKDQLTETTASQNGITATQEFFIRYLVGTAFAIGMCIGNAILIYELLAKVFQHPVPIAIGVFLTGMFSLFRPLSLLFESGEQDGQRVARWKLGLLEFGIPLVAAFFVVAWQIESQNILRNVATFLFLFMLFLIAGKLLLSTLFELVSGIRAQRNNRAFNKKLRQTEQEITEIEDRILPGIRKEVEELENERSRIPNENAIRAQRETSVSIFESEYALARSVTGRHVDMN